MSKKRKEDAYERIAEYVKYHRNVLRQPVSAHRLSQELHVGRLVGMNNAFYNGLDASLPTEKLARVIAAAYSEAGKRDTAARKQERLGIVPPNAEPAPELFPEPSPATGDLIHACVRIADALEEIVRLLR